MSEISTRKKFTTTIDGNILKEIKIKAINEGIDVSVLIEKMFKEYTDREANYGKETK